MTRAIQFWLEGQTREVQFKQTTARLPIFIAKRGETRLIQWGRRHGEVGELPLGAWARHHAILAGEWDQWFPKPVRIPATGFACADVNERNHWFTVTKGQFIQGLYARLNTETRLYLVTLDLSPDVQQYPHWPRIINHPS